MDEEKKEKEMKVIFLDIDGVMAIYSTMREGWKYRAFHSRRPRKYSKVIKDQKTLSRKCIKTLNRLVVETQAKIVISSAWRYGHKARYFQRLFESRGFCGEIIDMTPKWKNYRNILGVKSINDLTLFWDMERGNEINLWLEWNKHKNIESYIIIDDDVDDIIGLHENRVIQTELEDGFSGDKLFQEAVKKLKRSVKW